MKVQILKIKNLDKCSYVNFEYKDIIEKAVCFNVLFNNNQKVNLDSKDVHSWLAGCEKNKLLIDVFWNKKINKFIVSIPFDFNC